MSTPPTVNQEGGTASTTAVSEQSTTTTEKKKDVIVQYLIVRRDLLDEQKWPVGSVIGQACHASVAVVAENFHDPYVQDYVSADNIDTMRKVVMEVNSEEQLVQLHTTLAEKKIVHRLWVEQPENFPTAIAIKPYPRSTVQKFLRKLKLFS